MRPERHASPVERDERALVEACLACDDDAIDDLVAAHRPAIARLARALLGSEEVDDVCQDVYLRVFKRLGDFEHRSRLATWIYRVTLNVIRNRQRTARRRHLDAHVSLDAVSARDQRRPRSRTSRRRRRSSRRRSRSRRLRTAIRGLPPVQRRALALWTYSDSSLATIARSTGLSLPGTKRTLRLARTGIRARDRSRPPRPRRLDHLTLRNWPMTRQALSATVAG